MLIDLVRYGAVAQLVNGLYAAYKSHLHKQSLKKQGLLVSYFCPPGSAREAKPILRFQFLLLLISLVCRFDCLSISCLGICA